MGAFDLSIDFKERTANLKAQIANTQITTPKLHAGSLTVTDLNAVTINSSTINGSTISGSEIVGATFKTSETGDRTEIDGTNGIRIFDAANTVFVQIKGSVYAGILVNGLRSIDTNDIFLESQDQTAQLFVSQSNDKVSFVAGSVERGYVDNQDTSGAGNLATSYVMRTNGSLKRVGVQQGTGPGFGYLYLV
jgi:hypothetical protein